MSWYGHIIFYGPYKKELVNFLKAWFKDVYELNNNKEICAEATGDFSWSFIDEFKKDLNRLKELHNIKEKYYLQVYYLEEPSEELVL